MYVNFSYLYLQIKPLLEYAFPSHTRLIFEAPVSRFASCVLGYSFINLPFLSNCNTGLLQSVLFNCVYVALFVLVP